MGTLAELTPEEHAMLLAAGGELSPEQGEQVEAAHPGWQKRGEDCLFATNVAVPVNPPPEAPPTQPTPAAGAPIGMEALGKLVLALTAHYGADSSPLAKAVASGCLLELVSTLDDAELTALLAANGVPSAAIIAAHPIRGTGKDLPRCNGYRVDDGAGANAGGSAASAPGDDAFNKAINDYVDRQGMISASDEVASCMPEASRR